MKTSRETSAAYRAMHPELVKASQRRTRRAVKMEALQRYGLACVRCSFSDIRALQLDHIADDGNVERKSLGGKDASGYRFYFWLRTNGWPDGYQTLCANCNMIKHLGDNF